jgi:hypothetical protein
VCVSDLRKRFFKNRWVVLDTSFDRPPHEFRFSHLAPGSDLRKRPGTPSLVGALWHTAPVHTIRYDPAGRPSCEQCDWSAQSTGDAGVAAALEHTAHTGSLHRVTISSEQAGRRREFVAQCLCGWSMGRLATRTEAAQQGDNHRAAAAVAVRRSKDTAPAG